MTRTEIRHFDRSLKLCPPNKAYIAVETTTVEKSHDMGGEIVPTYSHTYRAWIVGRPESEETFTRKRDLDAGKQRQTDEA